MATENIIIKRILFKKYEEDNKMMEWADFLISAVICDQESNDRKFSNFLVQLDKGESVGSPVIWTRDEVLDKIENGKSFRTIYRSNGDKWKKGEDVSKIKIGNEFYLRTDHSKSNGDYLGNLPEF